MSCSDTGGLERGGGEAWEEENPRDKLDWGWERSMEEKEEEDTETIL